ncbi:MULTISPECIES: SHOCT domain-containing protein [Microbacterium]|uniref:SHOCT domain-containing protein n=1 Tax=Microbacterium TaxID=33882 RepID=UPI00146BEE6D|nr:MULTISPECIES: SHOCT domain-containing protein [Microbacterium]
MMWGYATGGWWMWVIGILVPLILVGALVVVLVLLMRSEGERRRDAGTGGQARELLEMRLARGEITPQEFREVSAALVEGSGRGSARSVP